MTTYINADDGIVSGVAGLKYGADNSGALVLQTNGTTAISISAAQVVTFTNAVSFTTASFTNLSYTGTLTGGTGVVNLGSGQFYKDASGNVGIGTSSPSSLLHLSQNGNTTALISATNAGTNSATLTLENAGQRNWNIWADRATDTFRIGNNTRATTNITLDSFGNVGIGTTPNALGFVNGTELSIAGTSNGGTPANMSGNLELINKQTSASANRLGFIAFLDNTTVCSAIQSFTSGSGGASGFGGYLGLYTKEDNSGGYPERMRIDSTGNVLVGTTSATVPSTTGEISTANTFGFKNRIINGNFAIDQRANGAAVTVTTSSYFSSDRWNEITAGGSKYSVQRISDTTFATGQATYFRVTSLAATTPGATDTYQIKQIIEGYNVADFAFGTAQAQPIAISFWVRSSLTGTFGGAVAWGGTGGNERSYPFTYSIAAANTWTQIGILIPADTTASTNPFNTTSSNGFQLRFGLGVGATISGTAGSWSLNNWQSATGAVAVVATSGATWDISAVQFEKGTACTSFDYRSITTELALCQRYYESSYPLGYAPGYNFNETYPFATAQPACVNLIASDDTLTSSTAYFKVTKRASPTTVIYSPNNGATNQTWTYRYSGAANVAVTVSISQPNFVTFTQSLAAVDRANESYFLFVANAEL